MSVNFHEDGSVTLIDNADPSRTALVPAGVADRDAQIAAFVGPPLPPDGPTLGDWRMGLALWGRLEDVSGRIRTMVEAGNKNGIAAHQRFEYSNHVFRADLMEMREVFGFSEAEVNESLWRASRIAMKDYSGVWPL